MHSFIQPFLNPYKFERGFTNFYYLTHDYIIFADAHGKKPLIEFSIFPKEKRWTDYYVAAIDSNKKSIFYFDETNSIKILGIYKEE